MSNGELVRSYNRIGVGALADLRRHNAGAELLLNDFPLAQLLQALAGPAPDGGLWHGRKVCDCLWDTFDIGVSRQQGWLYLKQMGFRTFVPRPEHQETDLEVQEEWQKKLGSEVKRIQQEQAIGGLLLDPFN